MFSTSPLDSKLSQLKRQGEERAAEKQALEQNLPYLNLTKAPVSRESILLITENEALKANIIPIIQKKDTVTLAVTDPKKPETQKIIQKLEKQGFKTIIAVVSLSSLKYGLNFYKSSKPTQGQITSQVKIGQASEKKNRQKTQSLEEIRNIFKNVSGESADTTELVEQILESALSLRASDVHLEPEEEEAKLRFRIDGILYDINTFTPDVYHNIVSRIKLLSGLKLNITTEPQDGRYTIKLGEEEIEVRTSLIPSEYGETIVMRVLDPRTALRDLGDLGIRSDDIEVVERALKKPNGMILVTGPTGSGKTTTLYAFLKKIQTPELKIITIENPIEYHLDGIEQTQVDESKGYGFSDGLKSILRQDPDVILVGEIRDKETAETAIQASLTGHLVFSTLHTNNAAGALPRLIDLGVRENVLHSALNLVVAQRLVRRLSEGCKEEVKTDERKVKKFISTLPSKIDTKNLSPKTYTTKNKKECEGEGYKGRVGVFELLEMSQTLADSVEKEVSERKIAELAAKEGMVTMQQDGVLKALRGVTSIEEVERETGQISW